MKRVIFTAEALAMLAYYRSMAPRLRAKIDRYAKTGAGDVKLLIGWPNKRRLRVGDFRVVFEERSTEIVVTKIGPRKSIYED